MTGAQLIFNERDEQLHKHKKTVESDVQYNQTGQLIDGALYCLTGKQDIYPLNTWGPEFKEKIDTSTHKKKLIVAGALIAAEIDRLQALEDSPLPGGESGVGNNLAMRQ